MIKGIASMDLRSLLSELSKEELLDLHHNILPNEIKRREESAKANARNALEELAAKYGFSIQQLYPEGRKPKTALVQPARVTLPPIYRSRSNPALQWSGKGRRPAWVTEYLNTGGQIDDLKIQ